MKFLIALAFKNLTRYGKRTVITASAIAFGLGLFIFTDSMLRGAERESEVNLINYETGSAKVMHPEYLGERDELPLKYPVENPDAVVAAMREAGVAAAPRTVFRGELFVREDPYPQEGSLFVKGIAIDPELDSGVYKLPETLEAGRFLRPGDNGVLLGSWLAADLGAEVGYPVTIKTRTRYGAYETLDLDVVGILNIPNPVMNKSTVFISLDTADYYLNMEGAVTEVALAFPLALDPEREAARLEEQLARTVPGLEIHSWKELAPDYVAMAAMKSSGSKMILFLVFAIAAVGISNTMLMAVYERMKELGMMRAMGMTSSQIRFTFLVEAGGIGLIGAVIGVLFGCLINWPMVTWGIDYTSLIREFDIGYRIAGVFRSIWNIPSILNAFAAGILIATVVALIPIRRALKLEITQCLRDE